jgi:bis(5'-nucleosidyl)-tetraphosphatase
MTIQHNETVKKYKCNRYNELNKRSGVIMFSKSNGTTRILVVEGKDSGIYSFPKGKMKYYETEEECALRELKEETGIELKSLKGSFKTKFGTNNYFLLYTDENKYKEFDIKDDNFEIKSVSWKTIEELKTLICNKDLRKLLNYTIPKNSHHNLEL